LLIARLELYKYSQLESPSDRATYKWGDLLLVCITLGYKWVVTALSSR